MLKQKNYNRIIAVVLMLAVLLTWGVQPTFGKYYGIFSGVVSYWTVSANTFTSVFVVTDDMLEKNDTTSKNLWGVGVSADNEIYSSADDTAEYLVSNSANQTLVIQNNSSETLLVCFDMIVCAYVSTWQGIVLYNTITEQSSGASLQIRSGIKGVTSSLTKYDMTMTKEDDIEVTIEYYSDDNNTTTTTSTKYTACSYYINPYTYSEYNGASEGTYAYISNSDFANFLLVAPGETKTFTISVEYSKDFSSMVGDAVTHNCFASINMVVEVFDTSIFESTS